MSEHLTTSLTHLPEELMISILGRLELKYLLRCQLVCRTLREIIKKSLQLQYNIELEADGLVDGVRCSLTLAERYALLMQRRKRWRFLDWTQVVPIEAPGVCQAYELVDGVFASSAGSGIGASRHLSFTWLPTQNGPVTRIEWEDLGLGIRDFAIDPSQDLMALVVAGLESDDNDGLDLVIALRSMSENKPHPNAAQAELRALVPFEVGTSFIQIVDDVIGVFFWVHDPGLIIFNWRTGKTVVRVTDRRIPTGLYDFAFLSSRAYMITVASGRGSIEIYAFSGDVEVTLSSQQQAQSAVQQVLPTQVAVLELPPVKPGKTVQRFTSHSGPFVGRRTPGRPFETSPDCKLHVMELSYGDQQTRFNLFVRNRYLLSYASPYIDSGETYTSVKKSWDEWGPDHARFLPIMGRFEWLRYVHGERVILPSLPIRRVTGTSSSARLMMTLDFNVHPKRLDDPVPFADESGATSFVQHNDVPLDSTLFEAPVVSRLPFVARLRELPAFDDGREYSGYMIDHEHLIGMRSSDDLDSTVQLDVYTF